MKKIKLAITVVFLFNCQHLLANGPQGGSGGGSELCRTGRLAGTAGGHSPHELLGFDSAVKKMRQIIPYWTDQQVKRIQAKNILFVDCEIKQLPSTETGNYFDSPNPCYQTDQELVCDRRATGSQDLRKMEKLFLHELVTAAAIAHRGTMADVRATDLLWDRPNLMYPEVAEAFKGHGLAGSFELYSGEYVRSFGQPQDAARMPIWEKNVMTMRCSRLSKYKLGDVVHLDPIVYGFDSEVLAGDDLAIFNGYLYEAEYNNVLNAQSTAWVPGYTSLYLSRRLRPGPLELSPAETIMLVCPARQ